MDFYQAFRWLLFALIVLNIVDGVTTALGVAVDGVVEGNAFAMAVFGDLATFLAVKLVVLSALLVGALVFLVHVHRPFPRLWENRVAFWAAVVVVWFYAVVVVNNVVLVAL